MNILQEYAPRSTRDRFADAFSQLSQNASTAIPEMLGNRQRMSQENDALQRMGIDLSGINDQEMRKIAFQEMLKGGTAQQQKTSALESSMQAINALEGMIGESGIGMSGALNPFGKARMNRGEFEATTAALLPMFKTMFPRGFTEKEFKVIQDKYLPKASDTEETIKGKLQGLKRIISAVSGGAQLSPKDIIGEESPSSSVEKVRFNLSNPQHKSKRDQLMKKFNGDQGKVREILLKEFEE
jgi:hypothetical protein